MNTKLYTSSDNFYLILPLSGLLFSLLFICPNTSLANSLTLTCPDDVTVQLAPGECEVPVYFDTLNWFSTEVLTDTIFFPPSGTSFEVGTNVITLAVTNEDGDLETCTFNVHINDFVPTELTCIQNVAVSLHGQCNRSILPEEFLELDSTGCIDNFEVTRLSPAGVGMPPFIYAGDVNSIFLAVIAHTDNGQQCLTQVTVTGGTPPSITCPPSANISCNEPADSSFTGVPSLTGCYQNVDLQYFDEKINTSCPDSVAFQINRTWIATDPFGIKDTCVQLITAYRFDIALVSFPNDFNGIALPPLQCIDSLTLEEQTDPAVTGTPDFINFPADNDPACKMTSSFSDDLTHICGGSYEIERIWTVVNLCDPATTRRDTQYIHVVDTLGPIFDIPDSIFVSLSSECADSLMLPPAANIIECSTFDIEIRTPWDTLTTNGGWTNVVLSPGQFFVFYEMTDICGNVSMDSSILILNNATLAGCPADTTVTCDYYFGELVNAVILGDSTILEQLGTPAFPLNCNFGFTETDSIAVTSCGTGSLFRIMVSDGNVPQACVQEIHVEHVSDFEAIFPPDTSICVGLDSANVGQPIISGDGCENVSFLAIDNIINGPVGNCLTIERTWLVTNSCVYSGVNTFDDAELAPFHYQDGGDGVIEYIQIIEVNDAAPPSFPEGCEIPDLYLFANSCEITVTTPTPTVSGCGDLDLFMGGSLGSVFGADVNLEVGMYAASYTLTDECGRTETCNTFFEVIDTIPPEVECKNGITVELMPAPPQTIEVWVSDLVESGEDNCSSFLTYSFLPDSMALSIPFGCCDIGQTPVEVWATDEYGNQGSCQTFVIVQSNTGGCGCGSTLSGQTATEEGEGIANVEVSISSPAGFNYMPITDADGFYETPVESGFDYTITPSKNTDPLNGVTTFDALLITKHILGSEPLDSPYKLIAADFNNSGSISTFDLLEMRKLILNITTEIPNNTSWRFVPADFEFDDPQDPFDSGWPEAIQINGANTDMLGLDFIGIKVGDVNGSAETED